MKTTNSGDKGHWLERRAGKPASGSVRKTRSTVGARPADFKRLLLKFCLRKSRQGRDFCLARLEILEYAQVSQSAGRQAAEQIGTAVQDACARQLRGADCFCFVYPGNCLILFPDTASQGAQEALERISALVASKRLRYKKQTLQASLLFQVADSHALGSDPEAMLGGVGCQLDQTGIAASARAPGRQLQGSVSSVQLGSIDAWLDRYQELEEQSDRLAIAGHLQLSILSGRDRWQDNQPVVLKTIELALNEDQFNEAEIADINKKAGNLQAMDHPGVMAIRDFQIQDNRTLFLVRDAIETIKPQAYLAQRRIDAHLLVDWSLQICNCLIYLQGMVPPVIPPSLADCLFVALADAHLILVDYEVPYLFALRWKSAGVSKQEMHAAAQGQPVAAYEPVIKSFACLITSLASGLCAESTALKNLLDRLQADSLPKELNTVFKIRSALKEIAETEKLGTFVS